MVISGYLRTHTALVDAGAGMMLTGFAAVLFYYITRSGEVKSRDD